jgi:hypothetical protein
VLKAIDRHVDLLQAELSELDRDIDGRSERAPPGRPTQIFWPACRKWAKATLRTLIAELPELGRFDRRKSPPSSASPHQSRERHPRRPQNNRRRAGPVRTALYMAALVTSRSNPIIAAHYRKLRAKEKAAKQALTACIRKLLVILNAILRDRKALEPTRLTTKTVAPDKVRDLRPPIGRCVSPPVSRFNREHPVEIVRWTNCCKIETCGWFGSSREDSFGNDLSRRAMAAVALLNHRRVGLERDVDRRNRIVLRSSALDKPLPIPAQAQCRR